MLAEPHAALAALKELADWDWAGAEAEYRKAIGLNPNDTTSHQVRSPVALRCESWAKLLPGRSTRDQSDRLVKLIQGLINALAGALRQVKASLHIELVGVGILGGMLLLVATATYFHPQPAGNVGGDVVLQSSDSGGLALVLLTPYLRAVAYIDHLGLDVERVAVLTQAAYNYRSHLQIAPDLQRILLRPPVAENRSTGHHPQPRQP